MTTPRTDSNYGIPKENARVPANPKQDLIDTEYNRLGDDVAQLTRARTFGWVHFPTALVNGAITPSSGQSEMGTGSGVLPTIARTGVGLYTITWPASWTDGIGTPETVGLLDSSGSVRGSGGPGTVQTSEAANVVLVRVYSLAAAPAVLSDLGGAVTIRVEAR